MPQCLRIVVAQPGLDRSTLEPRQRKDLFLLLRAGEVHDPDRLVRHIGLDKESAFAIKPRRGIARHPVAVRRQKIGRQMLGENRVIERDLLDIEKPGALQHTGHDARPGLPVRRVPVQREDAAIDHRVAAEPVRDAPAERLAITFPRQGPAEQFRTLVMALIGTVDLGNDRQPVPAGRGAIHLVTGKMPRQERPRHLRLQRFRCALAVGEIDIPGRADNLRGALGEPVSLSLGKAEIENADRDLAVERPHRGDRILQQREIAAIGGADDDQAAGARHGIRHGIRR